MGILLRYADIREARNKTGKVTALQPECHTFEIWMPPCGLEGVRPWWAGNGMDDGVLKRVFEIIYVAAGNCRRK